MLLAGNGFMNFSSSSFLLAQETPNALVQGNNTVQQNKNEQNLNNSEAPHPFSFNYDIDQMSCCNTVPRVEKKPMESGSTQVATAAETVPESVNGKDETNEKEEKSDGKTSKEDIPPSAEPVQSDEKEGKTEKVTSPKELSTPKNRKRLAHRSSF